MFKWYRTTIEDGERRMRREVILALGLLLLPLVITGVEGASVSIHQDRGLVFSNRTSQQYTPSSPLQIDGNTELAATSSSGAGTDVDPYIIESLRITSAAWCIDIRDCTAHFVIRNCILDAEGFNPNIVIFTDVVNGAVIDCHIFGASNGIQFMNCADCRIEDCYIYSNSANGIYIYQSTECNIEQNLLYGNNKGIMFEGSTYCTVRNNSIYRNTFIGIEFEPYSHNNTVLENSIGWNALSGFGDIQINVRNNAPDNRFDDGISIGNRWADFNESRTYRVSGDYRENDTYASLYEDLLVPYVNSPLDTAIDIESNGNTLTWIASDEAPYQYTILLNHVTHYSEIWDGNEITISLDLLHQGTHNITLVLLDAGGNARMDSVLVTAVSFVFGGMGTELVMLASGITVVVFILLLALAKKIL